MSAERGFNFNCFRPHSKHVMEGEIIHRDPRIALFTATEIRMALAFLNSVLIRTTWPSSLWSEFKGWSMPVVYYRELITMQWWWGHSFEQKCKMFENDNWQTLGAREREQAISGDTPPQGQQLRPQHYFITWRVTNDPCYNQQFQSHKNQCRLL